ncbi:hypothetical protein [Leptospira stimsonii]|uniref:hypothetical protein n=1 Tax=Leptospira stimsonii TaxID=2202203 RepID=UPI001FED8B17|nr:hypothetical protein [Leptospira stimsonii]
MKPNSKNTIPFLLYINLLIFLVFSSTCIKPNSGKLPSLFAAGVTPYSPADLGIPTPPPGSPLATLPAISDNERAAIEETLRAMNEMGYLSQEYFQKSSIAAWDSIRYVPIND